MSKHILVIDGLRPLHKKLKALGAELTLMSRTERINDSDAKLYDRIIGMNSGAKLEDWVRIALTINDISKIDGVGAYHEKNQDIAAIIADELKLPFNSLETIQNVNNKYRMREQLGRMGIDTTPHARVSTIEDIKEFADFFGYPFILKPINGWASIGVSVIKNESEISEAVEWFKKWGADYEMYVEEYLQGEEYSVEAMSENGRHRVLYITRKFKENDHFVEIGHCIPAELETEVERQIKDYVEKLLTGLDVRYGGTHTELIYTSEGPRIVETHTRLGGDFIPDLIETSSEIDLMTLWARQTMGENIFDVLPQEPPRDKHSAIWYVTPNAIGTLQRVEGLEEAAAASDVVKVELLQRPGSELKGMHDSFSRSAYIIATGSSNDEAVNRAREAAAKIRFIVSC